MKQNNFDCQDYVIEYDRLRCDDVMFHKGTFTKSIGHLIPVVCGRGSDAVCVGTGMLEECDQGIVATCTFNNTELGRICKEVYLNTDELRLSCAIYRIKRDGKNITDGYIPAIYVITKTMAFTYEEEKLEDADVQ